MGLLFPLKVNERACTMNKQIKSLRFLLPIFFILSVFMIVSNNARADFKQHTAINVIPVPPEIKSADGQFVLTGDTSIVVQDNQTRLRQIAEYLAEHLKPSTGFELNILSDVDETASKGKIYLRLEKKQNPQLGKEGYKLKAGPDEITITANTPAGAFYGIQTLLQLLPYEVESAEKVNDIQWTVPCVEITDWPRFAWRGLLLDVSRHFFTKQQVKDFIEQMARYKFNTFHWHLTDDPGWRIEIKKYPKLTEVGAWRVPRQGRWGNLDPPGAGEKPTCGGFYTQQDIREIVAYASQRFVTIVPEIEMPAHSLATLAAYPELACTQGPFHVDPGSRFYGQIQNTLCVGNEKVYEFLEGVFTEVAGLFDGEYIHMGGDEAFKGFWGKCPKCQKLMQEHNLKSEDELQSYFVKRVEGIIESKGRRLIGWDEILEGGLAPNATVMSWRGTAGGIAAAKMGHAVVMSPSPYYYLDLYQGDSVAEPATYGMSRLSSCYAFEPVPDGIEAALVLGVQGNLWTEEISEFRHAQYMTWPRGFAVAETAWSPKDKKSWPDFVKRIESQFRRFDAADIKYARSMYDVVFEPRLDETGQLVIELKTELDGLDIYYTFEGANPDYHYPRYIEPLTVPANAEQLRVVTYRGKELVGKQINMPIEELKKRLKK
jgi:hexosaminidase